MEQPRGMREPIMQILNDAQMNQIRGGKLDETKIQEMINNLRKEYRAYTWTISDDGKKIIGKHHTAQTPVFIPLTEYEYERRKSLPE